MKLLSKYIFKEQLYPFLTGFIFFTFILILNKLFILADLLVNKQVEMRLVLKLFLLHLPVTISLTIPMSVLISVIMAISRLNADYEIVALRANGISIFRIIKPIIITGIITFLLMIAFNETLLIYSNKNYNKIFVQILKSNPMAMIEEGIFSKLGDKTIWIKKIDKKSGDMNDAMLFSKNEKGGWDIIKAESGKWKKYNDGSKTLNLFKGRLFSSELDKNTFGIVDFSNGSAEIILSEGKISYTEAKDKLNPGEYNTIELYNILKKRNKSHKDDRDTALYWIELFKKQAIPFSCFVFALIGAPIGIISKRSSRGIGFGVSISIFFIYYAFFMTGQYLAIKGIIHPFYGVWTANLILLTAGIVLILIKERQ